MMVMFICDHYLLNQVVNVNGSLVFYIVDDGE